MFKLTLSKFLIITAAGLSSIYAVIILIDKFGLYSGDSRPVEQASVDEAENRVGNPILANSRSEISRLFPGNCFAEIYLKNPSFGGKLVAACIQQSVEQIKSVTGVEIQKTDITSPEVIAHLKSIYGVNNPWRH